MMVRGAGRGPLAVGSFVIRITVDRGPGASYLVSHGDVRFGKRLERA